MIFFSAPWLRYHSVHRFPFTAFAPRITLHQCSPPLFLRAFRSAADSHELPYLSQSRALRKRHPCSKAFVRVLIGTAPLTCCTVSAYGIKEKSTIAIVGGGDNSISSKSAPERRTEESTISQIRGELDKVREKLQPDVDDFLSALHSSTTSSVPPPQPAAKPASSRTVGKQADLAQEHMRLGELLLQSLLRLDAIIAEGEWEEARKERKGAVREVQGLLDRLDGGWKSRTKA